MFLSFQQLKMNQKPKTVKLVLSSGGARGMAHVGVIEEIEKLGWEIKAVSGSSMGAAVGGMYAAGKLCKYKDWMCTLEKMDVYRLMDFTLSSKGFIKGEKVFQELERILGGDIMIEDLPIKYTATALDFYQKKTTYFQKGSLLKAMRASVSVPTVLTPFKYRNRTYLDGGITEPIPVLPVMDVEADFLIIVNTNANVKYTEPKYFHKTEMQELTYAQKIESFISKWWNNKHTTEITPQELGYFSIMTGTIDLMMDKLSEHTLEKFQPDLLIEVSRDGASIMEFYKSAEMIEAGRAAFRDAIQPFFKKNRALQDAREKQSS